MERESKLSFLFIFLLGLGLIYVSYQQDSLQERVNQVDYLVIDAGIRIDNSSHIEQRTVHLTRGATAYEGLERVASVGTKHYPGMGEYITRINGLSNDQKTGKFWLIAKLENGNWRGLSIGADSYKLKDGDNILFWYGKSQNAPFAMSS